MRIKLVAHKVHGGQSQGMQEYAEKKFAFLGKHLSEDDPVKITVEPLKGEKTKIVLSFVTNDNHHFRVCAEDEGDFYIVTDIVKDKAKSQLERHLSKKDKIQRKGIKSEYKDMLDEACEVPIVKRKVIEASVMSEPQAIEEMERLGHNWFIFRNLDNENAVSLVYLRTDDQYGVVTIE